MGAFKELLIGTLPDNCNVCNLKYACSVRTNADEECYKVSLAANKRLPDCVLESIKIEKTACKHCDFKDSPRGQVLKTRGIIKAYLYNNPVHKIVSLEIETEIDDTYLSVIAPYCPMCGRELV